MNNDQNSISVSNDNMMRISVYDFELESLNNNFDRAMRCQSERSVSEVNLTYGCHVGDGDTPVPCAYPEPEYIKFGSVSGIVTRGWSGLRANEGDHGVHYLWRRRETPEEGYINCHMINDINPVLGLYVLYPSE